jgi:predicted P-loop ATPase/ribosomal protein L25 (general stress protein Ctc)
MTKISIYKNIKDVSSQYQIELDEFLANVRDMKWQDLIIPLWNCQDKKERQRIKATLPNCTVSGTFGHRKADDIKEHSGFIAIDFDDVSEPEAGPLKSDPFTYALHKSCSHTGYVCYVKIDKKKHLDSFNQLAEYYHNEYGLTADPSCKDVSRTRYVSADPDLYHNSNSKRFVPEKTAQAPKDKPKQNTPYVCTDDDIDRVIQEICDRGVDITANYHDWIAIAFALKDHYGDLEGLNRFIGLSQQHIEFDYDKTVKKWKSIMGNRGTGKATLATIFYLAKQNGISVKSERSRQIEQAAKIAKRQGVSIKNLNTHITEGLGLAPLSEREAQMIEELPDTFQGSEKESKENTVAEVRAWMNFNLKLWRCDIRQTFFNQDKVIDDEFVNETWERINLDGIKASKDIVFNLLTSGSIRNVNPVRNWFESGQASGLTETRKLLSCLKTKNQELEHELVLAWLVTVVQSVFSRPIPQMLVLTGKQRTGKTTFFRNLLPPALNNFYAESTLERGKDDEMLMCQKIVICNDEYKGGTVKEVAKMKDLLSKQHFTLRAPYGRTNKDYRRVATLCGTSNETTLIYDHTGNRRIFPVELIAPIDWEVYNSVDKELLWREIYNLWKTEKITGEIEHSTWDALESHSEQYREIDEVELWCQKHLVKDANGFTSTFEILQKAQPEFRVQMTAQKFGKILSKMGFEKTRSNTGMREWGYKVALVGFYSHEVGQR